MREKARGEEKNINKYVLGVEKTVPMQSILGYHFDETKEFIKVNKIFSLNTLSTRFMWQCLHWYLESKD